MIIYYANTYLVSVSSMNVTPMFEEKWRLSVQKRASLAPKNYEQMENLSKKFQMYRILFL